MSLDTLDRKKQLMMFFSICAGLLIGYALSSMPKLHTFKLLNIIGISFDLLAVIMLSQLVSKYDTLNRLISTHVVDFSFIFLISCPIGMLIISGIGRYYFKLPSSDAVMAISGGIASYLGLSVYGIFSLLETRPFQRWNNPPQRAIILGAFFLVSGLVIQLVAAFLDFFD